MKKVNLKPITLQQDKADNKLNSNSEEATKKQLFLTDNSDKINEITNGLFNNVKARYLRKHYREFNEKKIISDIVENIFVNYDPNDIKKQNKTFTELLLEEAQHNASDQTLPGEVNTIIANYLYTSNYQEVREAGDQLLNQYRERFFNIFNEKEKNSADYIDEAPKDCFNRILNNPIKLDRQYDDVLKLKVKIGVLQGSIEKIDQLAQQTKDEISRLANINGFSSIIKKYQTDKLAKLLKDKICTLIDEQKKHPMGNNFITIIPSNNVIFNKQELEDIFSMKIGETSKCLYQYINENNGEMQNEKELEVVNFLKPETKEECQKLLDDEQSLKITTCEKISNFFSCFCCQGGSVTYQSKTRAREILQKKINAFYDKKEDSKQKNDNIEDIKLVKKDSENKYRYINNNDSSYNSEIGHLNEIVV